MFSIFLVAALICLSDTLEESGRPFLRTQKRKSFTQLVFSVNKAPIIKERASCDWLEQIKRQKNLCLKRRGLPEALIEAKDLAIKYCEETFRYDQWNCSLTGLFLKKVYRETALMYSITSSAITYAIAKSCAKGTLAGCKCGDHGKAANSSQWHWGSCGDNTKFAKKFTKRFMQVKKRRSETDAVNKHNTEIGIRVVAESSEKICRCHGVSGACNVKICWKQVPKFAIISQQLKMLYHKASAVRESKNKIRDKLSSSKYRKGLVYLEESPDFCYDTPHRICKDLNNCATLCCGRGYYNSSRIVEVCKYKMVSNYQVQCDKQFVNKSIMQCKENIVN